MPSQTCHTIMKNQEDNSASTDAFLEAEAAIYRNELSVLTQLLNLTPSLVDRVDEKGRNLLMIAVLSSDEKIEICKLLMDRGCAVEFAEHGQKWTALHFASRDQKSELVRILLQGTQNVDATDVFGNTPLWRAVMTKHPNPDLIKLLLDAGANPKRKNSKGNSPLDLVIKQGHKNIALLFQHE
jgi:uncharacterized protein